jgi:hypothetical protein
MRCTCTPIATVGGGDGAPLLGWGSVWWLGVLVVWPGREKIIL